MVNTILAKILPDTPGNWLTPMDQPTDRPTLPRRELLSQLKPCFCIIQMSDVITASLNCMFASMRMKHCSLANAKQLLYILKTVCCAWPDEARTNQTRNKETWKTSNLRPSSDNELNYCNLLLAFCKSPPTSSYVLHTKTSVYFVVFLNLLI